jgi:hypothetical protein
MEEITKLWHNNKRIYADWTRPMQMDGRGSWAMLLLSNNTVILTGKNSSDSHQ